MQLQGNPDRYGFPQQQVIVEVPSEPNGENGFEEEDLDFLLKYMAPIHLTPDTLDQVCKHFLESSSIILEGLLSDNFSEKVCLYIKEQEASKLPDDSTKIKKTTVWRVAKLPYKHCFLYQQPSAENPSDDTAEINLIQELLEVFLPSRQFRRWLELAAECHIKKYDFLARRFRKGSDYALATSHDWETRLEISLGLTPTTGWSAEEDKAGGEDEIDGHENIKNKENLNTPKDDEKKKQKHAREMTEAKNSPENREEEQDDVGGHEVYMARDDDSQNDDAAIYKTSSDPDNNNVLFTIPANWNKISIVLQDSGVLKFVKYVSRNAPGDRWDITGVFVVGDLGDGEDDGVEGGEDNSLDNIVLLEDSDKEVFNGFPDTEDSESD